MIKLILQTIQHYWRQSLNLALGVALSTAVITGALIVGDSMRYSLENIAALRLGEITHTISAGDRYFTDSLAARLESAINSPCAPLLRLEGSAASNGGQFRLPKVQILGIDEHFQGVSGGGKVLHTIAPGEAYISQNLAARLNLKEKDELLLRIKKLSVIPLNAPFVSDEESIQSVTVTVAGILSDEAMGRFQLQHIQSAPFNVFLSLNYLHKRMGTQGKANQVLISASEDLEKSTIESALSDAWNLSDINLETRYNPLQNAWEVTSERVFIDQAIQEDLQKEASDKNFFLTYFVNQISSENGETPYSFVSTLANRDLSPEEIIITDWLAEDLIVKTGDSISLDYFVIGPLRELEEKSAAFTVKATVPTTGKWADQRLMPQIPGLSDVGNCRDWETGVPVDLEKIRKKDEDYWDEYRGAPKAYISYTTAQSLWKNRFGLSTLIRFPTSVSSQLEVESLIKKYVNPLQLGFQVDAVQEDAQRAASSGVDFSQLFFGLSFFLVLASLLLTVLLFRLNTESRMAQIGTLSVLGFTRQQIRKMLLSESLLVAAAGAAVGLILAIGYNQGVFKALNTIWSPIVRTQSLVSQIRYSTLFLGFCISLFISFLTIYSTLHRLLKQQAHVLQSGTVRVKSEWRYKLKKGLAYLIGLIAIVLVLWTYSANDLQNPGLFFAAGGLLLLSLLLFVHSYFRKQTVLSADFQMTMPNLIRQNISRNPNRSFLVIALFAIGTFIIVSTGSNRKDVFSSAFEKESGTGGFLFFAESTIPVLPNLNNPEVRFEAGLEGDYPLVQMRTFQGDDASCLNLNRVSSPRIFGVPPKALSDRFQFITKTAELDEERPWLSLREKIGSNTIPAVADQTVIQWGLGLKVGDTLQYLDESGQQIGLKLIGGLANSIFQGSVLIDEQLFLEHFPSSSGSNIFLIEGAPEEAKIIQEELELSFRDHGWQMQLAAERLATFNSVENTYLSIFLILGGLGLIIGTIGLGIVLARNLLSRKKELGLMLALGFPKPLLSKIIAIEHFFLLLLGVGIGILSSTLASLPSWLNPNIDISPWPVFILIGLLFLTGMGWILTSIRLFLKKERMVMELKEE